MCRKRLGGMALLLSVALELALGGLELDDRTF